MYRCIASAALALLVSGVAQAGVVDYGVPVPFTPCDGVLCIPVTLSDHKIHIFVLDTSYNRSTIAEPVARTLGWAMTADQSKGGKPVPGVWSVDAPQPADFAGVHRSVSYLAFSKDQLGALAKYDGTLDYTFFKDRVLEIDYKHHLIRVSALLGVADHPRPGKGELKLVNFHDWGPPIVVGGPFTVDGKTLEAQIDTSYTGTLLIFSAAIAPLELTDTAKGALPKLFPITDGGVDMLEGHANSVGFGDRTLDDKSPAVYFPTPKVHQPYMDRFQGTVGDAFFKDCVITLDFHDMTLDVRRAD